MDNDWPQFMAARQLCHAKSESSYANQAILSCDGGMGHPAGDESRQLSLSGHALLSASRRSRIGSAGILWNPAWRIVTSSWMTALEKPRKITPWANIESRAKMRRGEI
jgi:hypothetical protein